MNGRVLECGHYADAIPRDGQLLWLRYPNSALMSWSTAMGILERGWIKVNGVRASNPRRIGDCVHELEWDYDEPFEMPAGYSTRVQP